MLSLNPPSAPDCFDGTQDPSKTVGTGEFCHDHRMRLARRRWKGRHAAYHQGPGEFQLVAAINVRAEIISPERFALAEAVSHIQ